MGLRTILIICWMMPLALIVPILYQKHIAPPESVRESNTNMRVRMCREHIQTAKANPGDEVARTAVDECVVAGYITGKEADVVID